MLKLDIYSILVLVVLIIGVSFSLYSLSKKSEKAFIIIWGFVLGTIANTILMLILWNIPIVFSWQNSTVFYPYVAGTIYLLVFHILSRIKHYTYSKSLVVITVIFIYTVLRVPLIEYLVILLPADFIDNVIIH